MKQIKFNVLFLLALVFSLSINAQRGVRIGYIDTEYILENVPEYQEAQSQLESKVQKWKVEIESKLAEVVQKRKDLSNEKSLLTKELIDEREEDIDFEEKEILDYQQKRFGPNGDLMIQKKQLMQPIQDQIFASVQDIAEGRKYDFIFDKSSDAVMLYSAKQYDLSEQIIRSISRASKRTQVDSKSERKAAEDEELIPEINEELEAREKALEDKKNERAKADDARRQEILDEREARKKEAEAKRQQVLDDREKAKQEKLAERKSSAEAPTENDINTDAAKSSDTKETKTRAQLIEENRQKKLQEREERVKELEARKQKILEERQQVKDSLNNNK
jgi:Skp family chaperone for outer membrane proteins